MDWFISMFSNVSGTSWKVERIHTVRKVEVLKQSRSRITINFTSFQILGPGLQSPLELSMTTIPIRLNNSRRYKTDLVHIDSFCIDLYLAIVFIIFYFLVHVTIIKDFNRHTEIRSLPFWCHDENGSLGHRWVQFIYKMFCLL